MIRKVAPVLAAALLLAGCGRTTAGVAARVGDTSIETGTFARRVARAYENATFAQQTPRDAYQRDLLTAMVRARIIEVAAKRNGITVTDDAIDKRVAEVVAAYGGQKAFEEGLPTRGFRPSDVPGVLRTELLERALGDKLVADLTVSDAQLQAEYKKQLPNLDVARVAHILLRAPAEARKVAALAKKPGADFAALAKKYSLDTETKDAGGDLGQVGNGEGRFAKAFEQAVFNAGSGDVVGPVRTVTQGAAKVVGYEIIHVVDRHTQTFESVRDDLRRSVLADQRSQRMNALVSELAGELGVRVNPRFGVWDSQRLGIVAGDDNKLSSPAPVPGQPQNVAPAVVPSGGP